MFNLIIRNYILYFAGIFSISLSLSYSKPLNIDGLKNLEIFLKNKTIEILNIKKNFEGFGSEKFSEQLNYLDLSIKNLASLNLPLEDLPDEESIKLLENEEPEKFYYGYDGKCDYQKARLVAYANLVKLSKIKNDNSGGTIFIAPLSVLMMIYVNGQEVKRNFKLGAFFAILASWAPAERWGNIKCISNYKRRNWYGNNFRFCDQITSGLMGQYCTQIEKNLASSEEKKLFALLLKNWPERKIQSFKNLKKAAFNFFDKRSYNEVAATGTIGYGHCENEKVRLKGDYQKFIEDLEKNNINKFSEKKFIEIDKELNKIYKDLMNDKSFINELNVSKKGVRETQRAWLKYRDMFTDFIIKNYNNIDKYTIKAILTKDRIKHLKYIGVGKWSIDQHDEIKKKEQNNKRREE